MKKLLLLALVALGRIISVSAQTEVDLLKYFNSGWNRTIDYNSGTGIATITLTGDYGAAGMYWSGIDLSDYKSLVIDIDSYSNDWGQVYVDKTDNTSITQDFYTISSTTSVSVDLTSGDVTSVKQLGVKGKANGDVIKISRAYLVSKSFVTPIPTKAASFIPLYWFSGISNDAKVVFTTKLTGTSSYIGWGYGKIEMNDSSWGTLNDDSDNVINVTSSLSSSFSVAQEGNNTFECTVGDIWDAAAKNANSYALRWNVWGFGDGACTATAVSVVVYDKASVTIGSTGWGTFSDANCAYDFDGTGITAYIVKGASGTAITKEAVTNPAAGTGLLITGEAGTYRVPAVAAGTDYSSTNKMVAGDGTVITSSTGAGYNYVLVSNAGTAEFQKIASTSATVPVGKAYLALSTDPGASVLSFNDDFDNTTSVEAVQIATGEKGVFYNLAGQRVAQPTKGLYIVNGKKYIVK